MCANICHTAIVGYNTLLANLLLINVQTEIPKLLAASN